MNNLLKKYSNQITVYFLILPDLIIGLFGIFPIFNDEANKILADAIDN